MSAPSLAWFAGVFEGEGSIRINKPTRMNNGALCVSVTNTDGDLLDPFCARWAGSRRPVSGMRAEQRPAEVWTVASRRAMAFLEQIEPYVVRRQVLARIALAREFQTQKATTAQAGQRTVEYRRRQLDCYWRMRELNVRGVQPFARPDDWDAPALAGAVGWPSAAAGDTNPRWKLTIEQRREIATRALGGERLADLAAEFGVSETRCSQIKRRDAVPAS